MGAGAPDTDWLDEPPPHPAVMKGKLNKAATGLRAAGMRAAQRLSIVIGRFMGALLPVWANNGKQHYLDNCRVRIVRLFFGIFAQFTTVRLTVFRYHFPYGNGGQMRAIVPNYL